MSSTPSDQNKKHQTSIRLIVQNQRERNEINGISNRLYIMNKEVVATRAQHDHIGIVQRRGRRLVPERRGRQNNENVAFFHKKKGEIDIYILVYRVYYHTYKTVTQFVCFLYFGPRQKCDLHEI